MGRLQWPRSLGEGPCCTFVSKGVWSHHRCWEQAAEELTSNGGRTRKLGPRNRSHLQANQIKHAPDIEIKGLLALPVLELLKGTTPTTGGVGDEDIDADGPLSLQLPHFTLNLVDEFLDLVRMANVRWKGNSAAGDTGDGVQLVSRGREIRRIARCDDD